MTPTPDVPTVTIPAQITVERGQFGATRVFIDGEPFPYALLAGAGVQVSILDGQAPQLTLTLLAKSVVVRDALLDDGQGPIQHAHPREDPAPADEGSGIDL